MMFIRGRQYAVSVRPGRMFRDGVIWLALGVLLLWQAHKHPADEVLFWSGLLCILIGVIAVRRGLRLFVIAARMRYRG